jgi:hypothetical protein
LPAWVDDERLVEILSGRGIRVWRLARNGKNVTAVRFGGAWFLIAEEEEGKLLSGSQGNLPMGREAVGRFIQIYWRHRFEEIMGTSGYSLESISPDRETASFCMVFTSDRGAGA